VNVNNPGPETPDQKPRTKNPTLGIAQTRVSRTLVGLKEIARVGPGTIPGPILRRDFGESHLDAGCHGCNRAFIRDRNTHPIFVPNGIGPFEEAWRMGQHTCGQGSYVGPVTRPRGSGRREGVDMERGGKGGRSPGTGKRAGKGSHYRNSG
jgi:hypothetical protein